MPVSPPASAAPHADFVLREPRRPARAPLATATLCSALLVAFAVQQLGHAGPRDGLLGTNAAAALALGASRAERLLDGEVFRLLTAPWGHGGLGHWLGNLASLVIAGTIGERRLGAPRVLAAFLVGGAASTLVASLVAPETVVCGASGAILGVVAGALVATRGDRSATALLALTAAPAVLGSSLDATAVGHLAGAAAGAATALALPAAAAGVVAASLAAATFVGAVATARSYPASIAAARALNHLAPDADVAALGPRLDDARAFERTWPRDPRASYLVASRLAADGELVAAVHELESALDQLDTCAAAFEDGELEGALGVLAIELDHRGAVVPQQALQRAQSALCDRLRATTGGQFAATAGWCER